MVQAVEECIAREGECESDGDQSMEVVVKMVKEVLADMVGNQLVWQVCKMT